MSRVEFLIYILMITVIFYIYSIGSHGIAFFCMAIYALSSGFALKLKNDLLIDVCKLIKEIQEGLK